MRKEINKILKAFALNIIDYIFKEGEKESINCSIEETKQYIQVWYFKTYGKPYDLQDFDCFQSSIELTNFLVNELYKKFKALRLYNIADIAAFSMILEVTTYPSLGLVNLYDNGPHKDMDYFLFLKSIQSIRRYFKETLQQLIFNTCDRSFKTIARIVLEYGKSAEEKMFQTTKHINTHKGTIYLEMCLIGAYSIFICNEEEISVDKWGYYISQVAGYVRNINLDSCSKNTAGQRALLDFGLAGVRGEAEGGMCNVFLRALPYLSNLLLKDRQCLNVSLSQTLLYIQSELYDTTLLNRKYDINRIYYVQRSTGLLIDNGGILNETGAFQVFQMNKKFNEINLNTGGSADILTIALTVYLVSKFASL